MKKGTIVGVQGVCQDTMCGQGKRKNKERKEKENTKKYHRQKEQAKRRKARKRTLLLKTLTSVNFFLPWTCPSRSATTSNGKSPRCASTVWLLVDEVTALKLPGVVFVRYMNYGPYQCSTTLRAYQRIGFIYERPPMTLTYEARSPPTKGSSAQ